MARDGRRIGGGRAGTTRQGPVPRPRLVVVPLAALLTAGWWSPGTRLPVDAHTHLLSPAGAALLTEVHGGAVALDALPRNAADLLEALNAARIDRAVVISQAFQMNAPGVPDPDRAIRAENDWLAAQVGRTPDRLTGFCSVDPLRAAALEEIDRCGRLPGIAGVKLHLAAAGVDLRTAAHVRRLRAIFEAADRRGLALIVHLRASESYGAGEARAFVDGVLPGAAGVSVQVAHAAGWGGYDEATDAALAVFQEAVARGAPGAGGLLFDLAFVVHDGRADDPAVARLEARIRAMGTERWLFASDWPAQPPAETAALLAAALPGGAELLEEIAATIPPYVRGR